MSTRNLYSGLDDEIYKQVLDLSIKPDSCARRDKVIQKINLMLSKISEYKDLTVAVFGSTVNGLATEDSDMDLCITCPDMKDISAFTRSRLEERSNSIFNMRVLAQKLRDIGMVDVVAIQKAKVPICTFRDPEYGVRCDINVNNLLGMENTSLIVQYINLDSRVRPFLFALKTFVKAKEISDCRKGLIGTYAYTMIGLHYLMYVQDPPVIPCLQRLLGAICNSPKCRFKTARYIMGCDVRYHDCVYIENTRGDTFVSGLTARNNDSTIWHSRNEKDVGQLVTELFGWLSFTHNILKPMSITTNGHIMREMNWRKHDAIFPDPFSSATNILGTCTAIGSKVISQQFGRAYAKLNNGASFANMLSTNDLVPRPVDTKSIEYRFGHRDVFRMHA